MIEHLPALQVVVPLLTAPLCILFRHPHVARAIATAAIWFCLGSALTLFLEIDATGPISYALGGWAPPWGIEYRVDALSGLLLIVVPAIAAVALPIGASGLIHTVRERRQYLFCSAFLLCVAGLQGIAITADAFNAFVFLEISSLGSYTLVSIGQNRRALTAAFSYLIMGTIGGTFILIGVGLLYQMTGTLNFSDLAARLPAVQHQRTVHAAFAFITVGTSIKLAVFPLHQWLPDAYAYAPSAVSAFLSGTSTKVIYYLLIRLVFGLFGATFVYETLHFDTLLMPLSLLAMFAGALAAIYQKSVKRLLAYSSISQIGYLTLALSFGTQSGLVAGLLHVVNHGLMKSGLFLAVACLTLRTSSDRLEELTGLGRELPVSSAAFVVGGLGLIGVPATVGFVSKWYLVRAALETGSYIVAALVLLSSLLAIVYVWRVVEVLYFGEQPTQRHTTEAPWSMLVPTWVVMGATLLFGVFTEPPTYAARAAAGVLFEPAPAARESSEQTAPRRAAIVDRSGEGEARP